MSVPLLKALQLADSGFPSGAFAYSWGMETAAAHGVVTRASFGGWLAAEMLGRWAAFDRIVLAQAFRARNPRDVDAETDLLFMAEDLRARSAEAGQAFLAATARLGDPVATGLRDAALAGEIAGHLPVAQGAVLASQAVPLDLALAASAHAAAQGMASAGVRLGLVGAVEAQRALAALQPDLADAILPPPEDAVPASFAPLSEIAMLRPQDGRLFAN